VTVDKQQKGLLDNKIVSAR